MKVDVITIDEISVRPWRWWSNWIDVAVFDYGGDGYLLQMRVSRTNAKKFKAIALKSLANFAHAKLGDAGDLTQMRKA